MEPKYATGLVLSGGGPRGFAHFGVLKALDELGIPIDIVAATSAGAVAAAFWNAGYKSEEAFRIIRSHSIWRWIAFLGRYPGLLNFRRARVLFDKYLPASFEELKRPLVCTATDLLAAQSVQISSGPLISAICASSAIPILFKPVEINGRPLVDGGVMNNLPVDLIRQHCKKIIAVNVNPILPHKNKLSLMNVVDRSIRMVIQHEINTKKPLCDIFIEPSACNEVPLLQLRTAEFLFEAGYKEVMQQKHALLSLLH
jgi:NTE family protein